MAGAEYTRRYQSYCRAHGHTPKQQRAQDDSDWPGGCMTGFIIWSTGEVADWKTELGLTGKNARPLLQCEVEALDDYLDQLYQSTD